MSVINTYRIQNDEYRFELLGDFNPTTIIVTDISPLKQGYDNLTTDDVSVYPGNIELTVDGKHFDLFNGLIARYNNQYPFNYESILYLQIKKNGTLIFKSYLENIIRTGKLVPSIKLRFTDGINKLKNVTMGNPYLLELLHNKGFLKRYKTNIATCKDVYVYGFGPGGDTIITSPATESVKFNPDVLFRVGADYDKNVNVQSFIAELIKILNPSLTVEFDSRIKFKGRSGAQTADFDSIMCRYVLSNLTGRYIAAKKTGSGTFTVTDIHLNGSDDYHNYTLCFEDDTWRVWYHDWRGAQVYISPVAPFTETTRYFNKGIGPVKLNEFLKTLAKNFFARFEFYAPGKVKWYTKKRQLAADFQRINSIIDHQDESADVIVQSVKIKDLNNGVENNSGSAGMNANLEEGQKIEYSVPFTAIETAYDEEDRLYFENNDDAPAPVEIPAVKMQTEPGEDFDYLQRAIAKAEYNKQFISLGASGKKRREKRTITVPGTDYNVYQNYEYMHDGVLKTIKPVEIEKNEFSSDMSRKGTTRITGIAVTR